MTDTQSPPEETRISARTGLPMSKRGFAAMSPERRREIARKGGAAVPRHKRSFAKDAALASNAGRKGGMAARKTTAQKPQPNPQPEPSQG